MIFSMTPAESWFATGIVLLAAVAATFIVDMIMDILDERSNKNGRA